MASCVQFFFLKTERAISVRDGPPKSSWSVWRPHVVWTLTLGEGLTEGLSQDVTRLVVDEVEDAVVVDEAIVLG